MSQRTHKAKNSEHGHRNHSKLAAADNKQESGSEELGTQTEKSESSQNASSQASAQGGEKSVQLAGSAEDLLKKVTPMLGEARRYIEASPVRATAFGAIAGGLIMGLLASEKGRTLLTTAFNYSKPVLARYAKQFIEQAVGNTASQAIDKALLN